MKHRSTITHSLCLHSISFPRCDSTDQLAQPRGTHMIIRTSHQARGKTFRGLLASVRAAICYALEGLGRCLMLGLGMFLQGDLHINRLSHQQERRNHQCIEFQTLIRLLASSLLQELFHRANTHQLHQPKQGITVGNRLQDSQDTRAEGIRTPMCRNNRGMRIS